MKKLFAWIGIFFIVLFFCMVGIVFTPIGNKILAPFLQTILNSQMPFSSQIQELRIGFGNIKGDILINNTLDVSLEGTYSLSSLDIDIQIEDLLTQIFSLKLKAFGTYNDYTIKSLPNVRLTLQGKFDFLESKKLEILADNIPIQSLLKQLNLASESDIQGNVHFVIKKENDVFLARIQSLDSSVGENPVSFDFKWQARNNELLSIGDFTTMGKHFSLKAQSIADNNNIATKIHIFNQHQTPIITFNIPTLHTREKSGTFNLHIPYLETIGLDFNKQLFGSIAISGDFSYEDGFKLNAQSNSLGGICVLSFSQNNINFKGSKVELSEILTLFNAPQIMDAKLEIQGVYNLAFDKGSLNISSDVVRLTKALNVPFPSAFTLALESKINGESLDSSLSITDAQTHQNIQSSQFLINLAHQTLHLELISPPFMLDGQFWNLDFTDKSASMESLDPYYFNNL